MAGQQPLEKLRTYLRELPPAARTLLRTELQRAAARGEPLPGGDFILKALEQETTEAGAEPAPSVVEQTTPQPAPAQPEPPQQPNASEQADRNPSRLFFAPLEPFLVDDSL